MKKYTLFNAFFILFLANTSAINASTMLARNFSPSNQIIQKLVLVIEGQVELFSTIASIAEGGDSVLPDLNECLQLTNNSLDISVEKRELLGVYATYILESIGSPSAYRVLLEVSRSSVLVNIRGVALNSLATGYYSRLTEQVGITPTIDVLELMMHNADDTTMVPMVGKMIGEIARLGVKNWTGDDFGALDPENPELQQQKTNRIKWWKNNKHKYSWDSATKTFRIK